MIIPIKKKIFIFILFSLFSNFGFAQVTCSGSRECGELGIGLGKSLLVLGGLLAPHILFNHDQDTLFTTGLSSISLGAGSENIKQLDADFNSEIPKNPDWILNTSTLIQIYGSDAPSLIEFGIGGGYHYHFDFIHQLVTTLKLAADLIEDSERPRFGPELVLNYRYSYKENTHFDIETRISHVEHWAGQLQLSWHLKPKGENFSYYPALSYLENTYFHTKNYLLSIGFSY